MEWVSSLAMIIPADKEDEEDEDMEFTYTGQMRTPAK
jgi:hypothetical protein